MLCLMGRTYGMVTQVVKMLDKKFQHALDILHIQDCILLETIGIK